MLRQTRAWDERPHHSSAWNSSDDESQLRSSESERQRTLP